MRRILFPLLAVLVLSILHPVRGQAQQQIGQSRVKVARQRLRPILSLTGGFDYPISRPGLTQYWRGGVCGSITFLIPANRMVAFGIGLDGALLKFSPSGFAAAYPGVAVQSRDLGYLSTYLAWRYTPFSRYRLGPYIGANFGGIAIHRSNVQGSHQRSAANILLYTGDNPSDHRCGRRSGITRCAFHHIRAGSEDDVRAQ